MAKKKQQKKNTPKPKQNDQTNNVVWGLLLVLFALIVLGGMFGGAGIAGLLFEQAIFWLVGSGTIVVPIILASIGISMIINRKIEVSTKEIVTSSIGIIALLTLIAVENEERGGVIGRVLKIPLIKSFDVVFTSVILVFVILCSFALFFGRFPKFLPLWQKISAQIRSLFGSKSEELEYEEDEDEEEAEIVIPKSELNPPKVEASAKEKSREELKVTDASADNFQINTKRPRNSTGRYAPPPLSLLEGDRGKANVGDVKANANVIRRTLSNFGIEVEMDEVTIGPTVTRYALKPAQGVKLSRIVGLQNDLALSLAAHPLRIEAPIPGKSLVGIEIPNKSKATVGICNLLSDPIFCENKKPLMVALGRNIAGKSVLRSLAKMPHLLIAGTTGSGKSVTIHAIITSLLYRHGPDDLRLIFVDPKRVELTLYNGIPHLLTPVITDSKKAILALKWAATEMNRRYDLLEQEKVRDIDSYHKKYEKEFAKKDQSTNGEDEEARDRMPYIVIIIDELADIMQAYPRELEAAIVRLAQMSRAVGIHLILSTQRPEVNVITGLIKANVPARIALRVPTGVDSRTILDTVGAEKLLGQGDMLAMVGDSQVERLQSAFITEDEVKNIVQYLKDEFRDDIRDTIDLTGTIEGEKSMFSDSMENEDDDALYEEARMIVVEAGKASTSYIQRKLKVGYARAARLMDMLEERGVIGASNGAKPREVLDSSLRNAESDSIADEMGI